MRIGIATPSKSKFRPTGPKGYPVQGPINLFLQPAGFNQAPKTAGKFPFQVPTTGGGKNPYMVRTIFPLVDRPDLSIPDPRQDFQVVNFVNPNNTSDYVKQLETNWFINEGDGGLTIPCFQFGIGFSNSRAIPVGSSISATLTTSIFDADIIDDPSKWQIVDSVDCFGPAAPLIGGTGASNQVTGTITLAQSQAGTPPKMVDFDNINLNIPQSGAAEVVGVFNNFYFNLPEDIIKQVQDRKNFGLAIEYNITLQFAGEGPLNYTGGLKLAFRGEPIK